MSKAVMLSIRPKWCEKIIIGRKTMELRKSVPKLKVPFKCYIYCTSGHPYISVKCGNLDRDTVRTNTVGRCNGKVIGEFVCDYILQRCEMANADIAEQQSCIYGWHISSLRIYDQPRELSEFWRDCLEYSELSTNCWSCENVCGDGDETDCNTDGRLYLHRPPQSWCYVEAMDSERKDGEDG